MHPSKRYELAEVSEAEASDIPIKRRATSRRSPLLKGRPRGVWQPDLVGKIHAYPKTLEEHQKKVDLMRTQIRLYNAEGITGRSGVPDGWAGKKKLIKEINDKARLAAQEILDDMLVTARFVPDNAESQLAMRGALAMIVAEKFTPETETVPLYSADTRLKAMNLVLKFAQRAPTTSSVVTETTAEDFLKVLAKR